MANSLDNPPFDLFDGDDTDIHDLIRTPLRFGDDSQLSDYEAEEIVSLDTIDLVGRFR
ncbi:MAG: hypothetical protein LC104_06045 [Bacteroidales bacterium]|nr:hypothetical protein [Bacteroidales bacterium]